MHTSSPRTVGRQTSLWRSFRELLQDLRHAWSAGPASDQPSLRDYPLRRAETGRR